MLMDAGAVRWNLLGAAAVGVGVGTNCAVCLAGESENRDN